MEFMDFCAPEDSHAFLEQPAGLVLKRSGHRPLHFRFSSSSAECDKTSSLTVFQLLLIHGPRWGSAMLSLDSLHLSLLESLRGTCPELLSCRIMLQEPAAQFRNNMYAFKFAESIQIFGTVGLGPATSVFLPASRLTQFVDRRLSIDRTTLERIVAFLPLASNLVQVELYYAQIVGISSFRSTLRCTILPRVFFFQTGCVAVIDSVTLPALHALLVESISWPLFNSHWL